MKPGMNLLDLKPGTRVFVYAEEGTVLLNATVVRVNRRTVTIETVVGKQTVSPDKIADIAPGERDRLHRDQDHTINEKI